LVWIEWNIFSHWICPQLIWEIILQGELGIAYMFTCQILCDWNILSYNFCTLFTVVSCYRHVVYIWEWSRLLICFMSIGSQRGIVANLYCKLSNMGREGTVPGMWSIFHPISCWANIICSIPTYYKQVFHCSLFLTLKKKIPPYKASVFCCGNHSSSWNFTTHSCEEKNDLHVSVFWQDLHNQKHSSCSNRS